jgi:L-lactate permease
MELLLLLFLIPLAWLFMLPGRAAKRAKKFRLTGIAAIVLAVAAGWIGMQVTAKPTNAPVDYAASENDLRAILLEPEAAPRYSFNN